MRDGLLRLLNNLAQQRSAMIADDLPEISRLVMEQEQEILGLENFFANIESLTEDERGYLQQIANLVSENQLLAKQSLRFAQRVLSVFGEEKGYGKFLGVSAVSSGQSVDKRA